ncbi:hypothetical protein [Marinicella sp. W31]|uniref:hypothetical protein n=1 Tax=Marinicella sp. W31 TaxID=3023713 RepID=UPI003757D93E
MSFKNKTKTNIYLMCLIPSVAGLSSSHAASFDIGSNNWVGNFPGQGTYFQSVDNVNVAAAADKIIVVPNDPTGVYSGNDPGATVREFNYSFPDDSMVSIEFYQIGLNSSSRPEAIGDFSSIPDDVELGVGHIFSNNSIIGTNQSGIGTITKLTWNRIDALSFSVAVNGNVALIAHKNLEVLPDLIFSNGFETIITDSVGHGNDQ